MTKTTNPLTESSLDLASKAEGHANLIQSGGPSVQQEEAGEKAGSDRCRPMIWDGYLQRTGALDMDWDLDS